MADIADTIAQLEAQAAEFTAIADALSTWPLEDAFDSGDTLRWASTDALERGIAEKTTDKTWEVIVVVSGTAPLDILENVTFSWDTLAIELASRKINFTTEVFELAP